MKLDMLAWNDINMPWPTCLGLDLNCALTDCKDHKSFYSFHRTELYILGNVPLPTPASRLSHSYLSMNVCLF